MQIMKRTGKVTGSRMSRYVLVLFVALTGLTAVQVAVCEEASPQELREYVRTVDATIAASLRKNGKCIKKTDKDELGKMCAFEVDRGAKWPENFSFDKDKWYEICVPFKGFQKERDNPNIQYCSKVFCFDVRTSVTFWCILIGVPLSIIVAIIVLCYLCFHYAYYMCCCCLFHKPVPAFMNKYGHQVAPPSSQVAPSPITITNVTSTPSKSSEPSPGTGTSNADTASPAAPEAAKEKDESKQEPTKPEKEGGDET